MMGDKAKLLFVDDDTLMHRLYGPHIERAGYEVLSATDGNAGTEIAQRELPQLVVMDLIMPEGDGVRAIVELKKRPETRGIPIIAISADPQYHQFRKQLSVLGAQGFLTKPFSPAQLISEIRRLDVTE